MDVANVKQDIKTGNIKSFYIFTGDEVAVQNIYIEKLSEVLASRIRSFRKTREDDLSVIYTQAHQKSILSESERSDLFVCKENSDFHDNEGLWAQAENGELMQKNHIIFVYNNIDKRSKFYKHFKDYIVDFQPLPDSILIKHIRKHQPDLSSESCNILIRACQNSLSRILLELDKLDHYCKATGSSVDDGFKKLLDDGAIYVQPEDAIFDFADAVCKRQIGRAFRLWQDCLEVGENTMVALSVLYNNFRQVLQVQSYSGADVSKATGLTGWQIKMARDRVGHYRTGELVQALKTIRSAEFGIKTGAIDQEIAIDYVMVNIL